MAIIELSAKVKAIIVLAVEIAATALLGFADIFGWSLPLWGVITTMVVMIADAVFGIILVIPKKPSNKTGGTG